MKKILLIVGSLRKSSFNRQLAGEAAALLEGRASVKTLDFDSVPFMNQDREYPAPESVARVRTEVGSADAIWIFTPEYNYSYPGVLKNLLDWLSRPLKEGDPDRVSALTGKKAAISSAAGSSAGAGARAKLGELLVACRAGAARRAASRREARRPPLRRPGRSASRAAPRRLGGLPLARPPASPGARGLY